MCDRRHTDEWATPDGSRLTALVWAPAAPSSTACRCWAGDSDAVGGIVGCGHPSIVRVSYADVNYVRRIVPSVGGAPTPAAHRGRTADAGGPAGEPADLGEEVGFPYDDGRERR